MGLRFVKAEAFGRNCKITCQSRFLWFKPKAVEFVGDCTVWRSYPDGKRQPTSREMWLCGLWTRWKWEVQEEETTRQQNEHATLRGMRYPDAPISKLRPHDRP